MIIGIGNLGNSFASLIWSHSCGCNYLTAQLGTAQLGTALFIPGNSGWLYLSPPDLSLPQHASSRFQEGKKRSCKAS